MKIYFTYIHTIYIQYLYNALLSSQICFKCDLVRVGFYCMVVVDGLAPVALIIRHINTCVIHIYINIYICLCITYVSFVWFKATIPDRFCLLILWLWINHISFSLMCQYCRQRHKRLIVTIKVPSRPSERFFWVIWQKRQCQQKKPLPITAVIY